MRTLQLAVPQNPATTTVNLYEGETLIGSTTTITPGDGDSTWSITIDPTVLGNGEHTIVATAVIDGEESSESEAVTFTITLDCPPVITDFPEETVTECEDFTISGTTDPATTTVNLYEGETLIGSTTTITPGDGDSTWSITIDPTVLGNGEHTIVATAVIDGEESSESEAVTFTITLDCPPVITDFPQETVTDCEDFTISSTTDPATTTVNLYEGETLIGSTTTITPGDGDSTWSITIDPTVLGNGEHTIVATAVIDGEESSESEAVTFTITLDCPPVITDFPKRP